MEKIRLLKLLSPKYLQKEVNIYGYHYSAKTHIFCIISILAGSVALGMLFQLPAIFVFVIIAAAVFVFPLLILSMYRKMYEQKRFFDAGQYVQQVLYSFLKNQKVYMALKDCLLVIEEGSMHEVLEQALMHLEAGVAKSKQGVLREALMMIEEAYPSEKIKAVNHFMQNVEERGGEFETSVSLLLSDNSNWQKERYALQAKKKQCHIETVFCVLFSTLLCVGVLYVLNWSGNLVQTGETFHIFSYRLIQLTSTIFIIFNLLVFYKSSRGQETDWMQKGLKRQENLAIEGYQTIMNYDKTAERRKSLFFSIPFFAAAVAFFILQKAVISIVCISIAIFLLFQDRIGYRLAKESVEKELMIEFPEWLMDLSLLLQNNNVYVSLQKSYENAKELLKPEIELLLFRIESNPEDVRSYTAFFEKFEVHEINSCMQMLYALSETGNGDAETQMKRMIEGIYEMRGEAQRLEEERVKMKAGANFFYPIAAACVKMTIDMTFGMVTMIAMLGNFQIGG